jgi:ATP-binding cassette subfamily B (MDR/TAP) protein 1
LSIRRSESRLETDGTYLPRYENLEDTEHIEGPSTWRLIKLNAGEWHYALLGSVNAILSGWKSPFTGLVMSTVLVSLYTSNNIQQEVDKICIYMTIAIPISVIVFLLHAYAFELMGERMTLRVREKMFSGKRICNDPKPNICFTTNMGWFCLLFIVLYVKLFDLCTF